MSSYELIAFDMDGTLLDSDKNIRESSLAAIHDAAQQGRTIVLSTGRCLAELEEFFPKLPDVRYVIGANGAFLYDIQKRQIVHSSQIPFEIVAEIFSRIQSYPVMTQILSIDSIVPKDLVAHMADYHLEIYQKTFDMITVQPDDIEIYYCQKRPPVYKFNIHCQSTGQRKQLRELLADLPITMVDSEITCLECSLVGITKGTGLIKLCEHLNISLANTIAVGDSDNDADILKTAGLSAAMGNANHNIRQIADIIVSDNDHDGCAQVIREYLLSSV